MSGLQKLVLVVSDDPHYRNEAGVCLNRFAPPGYGIHSCSFQELFSHFSAPAPSLIVVHLVPGYGDPVQTVHEVVSRFRISQVACAGQGLDLDLVLKLIRSGAKDFLTLPFREEEVRMLFSRLAAAVPQTEEPTKLGKIITLFSPKGGTGVTLVSANLGAALAKKKPHRVAVCDLSNPLGDIGTYLNLTPQYTIRDLIDNYQLLDTSLLEGVMVEHPSGIHVLAAPHEDQEPLSSMHLKELRTIFLLLRQSFDFILIDAGHTDPSLTQLALMECDLILLLGNLDLPSLKGLVSSYTKLLRLHYDPEKIKIIINRYNSKNQLDLKEFEKKVRHPISARLPNNYSLCVEAINTGRPLSEIHENSDLVKQIAELARSIQTLFPVHRRPMSGSPKEDSVRIVHDPAKKGILRCLF